MSLDGLLDAMHGLASGELAAKVMVVPQMSETSQRAQSTRVNHVAMSLPAGSTRAMSLPDAGANRADIVAFYDEVFGWKEIPQLTEDRQRLVLMAYRYDQFVFLIADEPHMTGPRLDHFGMGVDTDGRARRVPAAGPRRSRRRTTASTSSTRRPKTTASSSSPASTSATCCR